MIIGAAFAHKDQQYLIGAVVGLFIGVIIGTAVGSIVGATETESFPVYKVIVSDNVSLNDFRQKYEILDQDGKIYTVKERATNVD